jgi:hypothetical protein
MPKNVLRLDSTSFLSGYGSALRRDEWNFHLLQMKNSLDVRQNSTELIRIIYTKLHTAIAMKKWHLQ